jgi:uncharacterized protein YcbK (DUF882 family)
MLLVKTKSIFKKKLQRQQIIQSSISFNLFHNIYFRKLKNTNYFMHHTFFDFDKKLNITIQKTLTRLKLILPDFRDREKVSMTNLHLSKKTDYLHLL